MLKQEFKKTHEELQTRWEKAENLYKQIDNPLSLELIQNVYEVQEFSESRNEEDLTLFEEEELQAKYLLNKHLYDEMSDILDSLISWACKVYFSLPQDLQSKADEAYDVITFAYLKPSRLSKMSSLEDFEIYSLYEFWALVLNVFMFEDKEQLFDEYSIA